MHYISDLIEQLTQRLLSVDCSSGKKMQITLPLPLNPQDSLLDWLDGQTLFPAFYWCNRDNSEEVVACGAAIKFIDIASASQFINQFPQTAMRVWGLNAFGELPALNDDKEKSFLFLPRLEISRSENRANITINLYGERSLKEDVDETLQLLRDIIPTVKNEAQTVDIISVVHEPDQAQWDSLLQKALNAIENRQFDKVVMARKTTLTLKKSLNPVQFMNSSKKINHHCFHFMLRFDNENAFLGSSPEQLFHRQGYQLMTEALAGTVASSSDEREAQELANWLMSDRKNQYENQLVVDDICDRLRPFVKKMDVQPVEIIRLRKVQHLRHRIQVELDYINDMDCLHWLQPTAAVAGLPRKPALHFILKNEPFDREWYAGSAGYLSYKQSEFSVTLRSALVNNNKICLYAGAGIIAGSDPLYEWLEIENKAAGLRTLLTGS